MSGGRENGQWSDRSVDARGRHPNPAPRREGWNDDRRGPQQQQHRRHEPEYVDTSLQNNGYGPGDRGRGQVVNGRFQSSERSGSLLDSAGSSYSSEGSGNTASINLIAWDSISHLENDSSETPCASQTVFLQNVDSNDLHIIGYDNSFRGGSRGGGYKRGGRGRSQGGGGKRKQPARFYCEFPGIGPYRTKDQTRPGEEKWCDDILWNTGANGENLWRVRLKRETKVGTMRDLLDSVGISYSTVEFEYLANQMFVNAITFSFKFDYDKYAVFINRYTSPEDKLGKFSYIPMLSRSFVKRQGENAWTYNNSDTTAYNNMLKHMDSYNRVLETTMRAKWEHKPTFKDIKDGKVSLRSLTDFKLKQLDWGKPTDDHVDRWKNGGSSGIGSCYYNRYNQVIYNVRTSKVGPRMKIMLGQYNFTMTEQECKDHEENEAARKQKANEETALRRRPLTAADEPELVNGKLWPKGASENRAKPLTERIAEEADQLRKELHKKMEDNFANVVTTNQNTTQQSATMSVLEQMQVAQENSIARMDYEAKVVSVNASNIKALHEDTRAELKHLKVHVGALATVQKRYYEEHKDQLEMSKGDHESMVKNYAAMCNKDKMTQSRIRELEEPMERNSVMMTVGDARHHFNEKMNTVRMSKVLPGITPAMGFVGSETGGDVDEGDSPKRKRRILAITKFLSQYGTGSPSQTKDRKNDEVYIINGKWRNTDQTAAKLQQIYNDKVGVALTQIGKEQWTYLQIIWGVELIAELKTHRNVSRDTPKLLEGVDLTELNSTIEQLEELDRMMWDPIFMKEMAFHNGVIGAALIPLCNKKIFEWCCDFVTSQPSESAGNRKGNVLEKFTIKIGWRAIWDIVNA